MNLETSLARALAASDASAVDLAHCQPFRLGPVEVVPASRSLQGAGADPVTIQPLAMRVLIALAAAGGETCSRDDLVEACWNQRIVGDDAVHRIISTLRRDLAQVGGGAVAIETIPKVGYRLRMTDADGASSGFATGAREPPRVARPWLATLLLLGAVVSAGVLTAMRPGDDVTAIAVVADGSVTRGEGARFADGLTGDLARLSSAMPSLAFVEPGGRQEPLLLRVALDPAADKPTARVRLVDRKGGAVIWSRNFAAESGATAELRELVANGVAGVVQCGLERSARFDEPVGLRLYLGACEGLETGDFVRARTFAQQITAFRPDSPAGWACLANTTIFSEARRGAVDAAVLARAENYAKRALTADPTSGLAYVALAMAASWRHEPSLAILEQGLRVDPDFAMLHKHYAMALTGAGMASEAVDPALRALTLHPHDPGLYRIAVAALVNAGRNGEALALSDKMQRLWRYDDGVEMQRLDMLFYAPDPKVALAAFEASRLHASPTAGRIRESLIWRTDRAGYDWSQFDRVAHQMYAHDKDLAWRISATAARMGDPARALEWLRSAPSDAFLAWTPLFAPEAAALRRDVRFFDKMVDVGMVRRWQRSGRWPDFCADPDLTYNCRARAEALARRTADRVENGGWDPLESTCRHASLSIL